jgi:hypothetical protein
MKAVYLLALLLVAVVVVALTFTTTAKPEIPEEEMDSFEGDLDSIDALMQEFDSLDEMDLEEINESLFTQ